MSPWHGEQIIDNDSNSICILKFTEKRNNGISSSLFDSDLIQTYKQFNT